MAGGLDSFTKLLLHCEGADASTTFTDSSDAPHTVGVSGNAQVDTAQFKFGAASCLLDGTGDGLTLDGSADFTFGTGDFAIDFWLRPSSVTGTRYIYDGRPSDGTNGLYPVLYWDTVAGRIDYYVNSANRITGSTVLSANTWYHVALARSGTSTKLFINGTQEGSTYSDSNNYLGAGASRPSVGVYTDGSSAGFAGWLDEFRISKGIARWEANFTPPNAPYGRLAPVLNSYRQRRAA